MGSDPKLRVSEKDIFRFIWLLELECDCTMGMAVNTMLQSFLVDVDGGDEK